MKSVMLILGACIIILLLSAVIPAINDFRSEEYTESHGVVTTGVGGTTANLTLTQDLFLDENSEVESVTSNVTNDVPLVSTYTSATDRLLITGLVASTARTLTVVYNIPSLDNYYAVDIATRVIPLLLVLGVFGLVAAAVYAGTRRD